MVLEGNGQPKSRRTPEVPFLLNRNKKCTYRRLQGPDYPERLPLTFHHNFQTESEGRKEQEKEKRVQPEHVYYGAHLLQ